MSPPQTGPPHLLVVAKAPEPGKVKTRLDREFGMDAAAAVAAASLLDTLVACTAAVGADYCHLSMVGDLDLDRAVDGDLIREALVGWTVHPQAGGAFGDRLARAHALVPGPIVQIGMDTPQVTPELLLEVAAGLEHHDAVLAPAEDGGWWALGLRDPSQAEVLRGVPMSTETTYDDTLAPPRCAVLDVGSGSPLRDVDTVADADADIVAAHATGTRFAEMWTDRRPRDGRPVSEVFTRALKGAPCEEIGLHDRPRRLRVHDWTRTADGDDLAMVAHCEGATIDIGCGPGRLTEALAGLGRSVLGIDVVRAAVGLTRSRGVSAFRGDVFEPVPQEGQWRSALLADGNVGIGGDPVALLGRVRELLVPGGQVVVELAGPGEQQRSVWASLACGDDLSRPFRWAVLGTDDIDDVAERAGLAVRDVHAHGHRWCAVLEA